MILSGPADQRDKSVSSLEQKWKNMKNVVIHIEWKTAPGQIKSWQGTKWNHRHADFRAVPAVIHVNVTRRIEQFQFGWRYPADPRVYATGLCR